MATALGRANTSTTPLYSKTGLLLTIGAIGVVFGDIGTSPLYAFREALGQSAAAGVTDESVLGVLSLAIWALILIVSVKYVGFLMRADNQGEGGVLALTALARRALGRKSRIALLLGATGAALFYGDAIITPALSVLSAVEGLRTIPAARDAITEDVIMALTIVILIALFAIQARGTAHISKLFGPVCVLWFVVIGGLGLWHIADELSIVRVFLPWHGVFYLATHGTTGLFVLGAVFLTVTGAEALTADMGHFGRAPIRLGWFALAFPALVLNYLGQGALALKSLELAEASHQAFANQDWFFLMAPSALRPWLVLLATFATIIASQAVITGAFSLTQQAVQLGFLPRLRIKRTSAEHAGQIYLPVINWLLLVGVLVLVVQFRNSSAMAAAYGIAVTGTMVVTTCLAFIVVHWKWKWGWTRAALVVAPFLLLDLVFFGANILRVVEGGWVPLAVAAALGLLISTWVRGKSVVREFEYRRSLPIADLAAALSRRPPERVAGTAVFLTSNPRSTPGALLHNLKHNKVLHARNLIASVKVADRPFVAPEDRIERAAIDANFESVTLTYGFMESPDVPSDLGLAAQCRLEMEGNRMSFFIGRNTIKADAGGDTPNRLPPWRNRIYMFLQRNAADPTEFFHIPPGKVVELGEQVSV